MWNFASNCIAGTVRPKKDCPNSSDCSDEDEDEDGARREEGLECPICWESFNIVENVPYVLWCGHTLCKNCILGLQWAVVKFPTLPVQLPLFISCPWCNLLSFRLVYKGNLRFPRKNYFLLWMVESFTGDRLKNHHHHHHHRSAGASWPPADGTSSSSTTTNTSAVMPSPAARSGESHYRHRESFFFDGRVGLEGLRFSARRALLFFVHLTAKFPLVVIFLLILLYAVPASAAILALYVLVTVLFALPSFLILYFSYPSLDWLVREIVT